MGPVVVVGVAGMFGLTAMALTPWLVSLARTESVWLRSGLHPLLATLGGAGAASWADSVLELLVLGTVALACSLLVVVDLAAHRLPDILLTPPYPIALGCFAVLGVVEGDYSDLWRSVLAGAALAAGYLVLALISPSGMGMGDVKLAGLLGVVLGWYGWEEVLTGTIAAFVLGGLFAVGLLVTARADRKTQVAFGPWMILGSVVGLVWGGAVFGG
ncbi:prepilin peptidase [Pseudactinotalea sp. Z1739]|uniref:prepilin peptidase n=1 Tax=Pseudactinotalea sp. Z1739 TaxID=3413028 RepID=UPI003C7BE2E6